MRFQLPEHLLLMGETQPRGWTLSSGGGLELGRFLLLRVGPEKEVQG